MPERLVFRLNAPVTAARSSWALSAVTTVALPLPLLVLVLVLELVLA
jgi:hypothetical protein